MKKDIHIIFAVNEDRDENLGLMSLSAVLKQNGFCPAVKPAVYGELFAFLSRMKNEKIILAFSATGFSVAGYIRLSAALKKDFEFISVFGGYYPTGNPDIIDKDGVDIVCRGEGEYAFLDLAEALARGRDISGISNLWVKQENRIFKNSLRPLVKDLDSLPFCDRQLFSHKSLYFKDRAYVITSRGCYFHCPHCYNSTYKNLYKGQISYRRRSVENVIEEIRSIQAGQALGFILFYDDIFVLDMDWLKEFSRQYRNKINIPFRANVRLDLLNEDSVRLLKQANCRVLSFGLETANEKILKTVLKRNISIREVEEKAKMIKQNSILLRTTNMIGIARGSVEDDWLTLRLNVRCKADYALVSMFGAYPDTDFTQAQDLPKTGRNISTAEISGSLKRLPASFFEPQFGFKNEREKMMIANLHELFTFAVSFPFLLPLVKVLIRLPLRRIYRKVNLLWSWYCSFFRLYRTRGVRGYLSDRLRSKDRQAEALLFKKNNKPHIRLSPRQYRARAVLQAKIDSREYCFETSNCICSKDQSLLIAKTDRYGLDLNFVLCRHCGTLRQNPRLNAESARSFYRNEYRQLFMEQSRIDKKYISRLKKTGRTIINVIRSNIPDFDFTKAEVLDVGCSTGSALSLFADLGAQVSGLDYDQRYIAYGKALDPRIDLAVGGLEDLPEDKRYDLIICNHLFEHLNDPGKTVRIIRQKLKAKGLVYIAVPEIRNISHYASPTKSFLGALHISHNYYFTKHSLLGLMADFRCLYADDQVRALFEKKDSLTEGLRDFPYEHDRIMGFLYDHQKSLGGLVKRSVLSAGAFIKDKVI